MRFCCLACGGFWKTKSEFPTFCPYCGDRYFNDNVTEQTPLVIRDILVECAGCSHIYYVESDDDHNMCPICGIKVKKKKKVGDSLRAWQAEILKRLKL